MCPPGNGEKSNKTQEILDQANDRTTTQLFGRKGSQTNQQQYPWDRFNSKRYVMSNYSEPQAYDIETLRFLVLFFKKIRKKKLDRYSMYQDPLNPKEPPDKYRDLSLIGVGMGVNPFEILAALTTAGKITAFEYSKNNRDFLRYVQENIGKDPEITRVFEQWWEILHRIDNELYPMDFDWKSAIKNNIQIMRGDLYDPEQCKNLANQFDIATQFFTNCSATDDPKRFKIGHKHFVDFARYYFLAHVCHSKSYTTTYDGKSPPFPAIDYSYIDFVDAAIRVGAEPTSTTLIGVKNLHPDTQHQEDTPFYLASNLDIPEMNKQLRNIPLSDISEMLRAPRGKLILKTLIFLAATGLKYKVPKNVLAKMEENLNPFWWEIYFDEFRDPENLEFLQLIASHGPYYYRLRSIIPETVKK